MSIISPIKKNIERELVPAGNHIARLYSIVHIGIIDETYMGEDKQVDKVRLSFELPTETRDFGGTMKPMVISQEYTNSMHEKARLGGIVRGMLGIEWGPNEDTESMDITTLIGKACMLNVTHKTSAKGNEYEQIVSAAPLPKGIEAKDQFNPSFIFDYDENWSDEAFEKFPDFIKEKIRSSKQYYQMTHPEEVARMAASPVNDETRSDGKPMPFEDDEIKPEDVPFD